MKDISFSTIKEIKKDLANNEYSIEDVVQFYIDRFKNIDGDIKSALEIFDKDSIIKRFKCHGILEGIPGLIKDNIAQKGRKLTCASKMLEGFESTYDATVISRLEEEGALFLGRANMDEFAMGSSNETSAFFKTKNPWNNECVPGGSSGGSAAAVAAGLVPWALGSETGGSVRQPAALCGITGLKPTYGAISRFGTVAFASSLDQVGILTRSVYDNALVFSALAGHDQKDASTLKLEKKDYTESLTGKIPKGLKIGVVKTAFETEGLNSEVKDLIGKAVDELKAQGAEIREIELPTLEYGAATYFIISRAEAASNLARYDGVRYEKRAENIKNLEDLYVKSRSEGFGKEVQVRMMVGNYVLSAGHSGAFYNNAKKVQSLIRKDFETAFEGVDLLVMPTQPASAFKIGVFDNDKLQMDLQDYYTCPVNLAGICAISIPCGFTKQNMPIGFQLIGPRLAEQKLFEVGHAYQQITDWHKKHPKL